MCPELVGELRESQDVPGKDLTGTGCAETKADLIPPILQALWTPHNMRSTVGTALAGTAHAIYPLDSCCWHHHMAPDGKQKRPGCSMLRQLPGPTGTH